LKPTRKKQWHHYLLSSQEEGIFNVAITVTASDPEAMYTPDDQKHFTSFLAFEKVKMLLVLIIEVWYTVNKVQLGSLRLECISPPHI